MKSDIVRNAIIVSVAIFAIGVICNYFFITTYVDHTIDQRLMRVVNVIERNDIRNVKTDSLHYKTLMAITNYLNHPELMKRKK